MLVDETSGTVAILLRVVTICRVNQFSAVDLIRDVEDSTIACRAGVRAQAIIHTVAAVAVAPMEVFTAKTNCSPQVLASVPVG